MPLPLLALMLLAFILLLGYNRFAGLRPDVTWRHILVDSVEEMGIGLLISFGILLMLDRIQLSGMGLDEIVGKVVVKAMAVSIGVSIGTAQLGNESDEEEEQKQGKAAVNSQSLWAVAVLAICGSIIVGGNVAPTEEILILGITSKPIHILWMAVFSVIVSVVLVYFSDFIGSGNKQRGGELAYTILLETTLCYTLALATSAFLLWFFGRLEGMNLWNGVAQTIALGVPSSLGASAGRLLIK